MFESVTPDPGAVGLARAARIFYVIAVLAGGASVIFLIFALMGDRTYTPIRLASDFGLAALAFVTGRGIDNQKTWAKWTGYVFGIVELVNVPIGTVVGIAAIVYIYRASKAGLFR
ncbi:MAG: hypothetical protein ACXV7D_16895 [Thermoanaerobaculia bacterium]